MLKGCALILYLHKGKVVVKEAFVPSIIPPVKTSGPALWFIVCGNKMLVKKEKEYVSIPLSAGEGVPGISPLRKFYLGTYMNMHCYAAEIDKTSIVPDNMELHGLWGMFNHLNEDLFKLTLRAYHIIDWDRNYQFCDRCGSKTENKTDEHAKKCTVCGHISFLRISPAVIVLVSKGSSILLARSPRFKDEMYSVLAGFVEPGETLEDTVKREIREEVGIDVKDIRYFGSQPWPFPDSLMIGFTAAYAGGDIRIDRSEIVDAGWYDCSDLPGIPGEISIARKMIDWFIEKQRTARKAARSS